MEWNEKLQAIIDYVENHLQRTETPVNTEEIAKMAECSYSFFQKVFSYMNGISFADYVRYRKLTLAGYDLKSTDMKVLDISYKYGYDSPTSFTKAFQQFHGISPREARGNHSKLMVFPKMQISIEQQYSWGLEKKAPLRLIGKCTRLSCKDGAQITKVPEFWSECQKNGVFAQLAAIDAGAPKGMLGLFTEIDTVKEELTYAIMVQSDRELPEGFAEIVIPETMWAVFDIRGPVPVAIQKGWNYLTKEWLIQYPFQHGDCPEVEWYSDGNAYDENYLSQIWIPLKEAAYES